MINEFFPDKGFLQKVNHNTLHFGSFLAKTNVTILCKSPKTYFWAILCLFGPFLPIFEKMRIFPKNPALSLFYVYGPLTSCNKLEKTNEPILRTVHHRQTDDTFLPFLGPFALNLENENFPRYGISAES